MKMLIPSIGDKIVLTSDWEFACFEEYRNIKFIKKFKPSAVIRDNYWRRDSMQSFSITLPVGTVLRVDRIYIRSGKKEWDSITFSVCKHPHFTEMKRKIVADGRFWAKLEDVNEIEFESYKE